MNLAALAAEVADESAMIDSDHDYRLGFDREAVGDARYVVIGDASMLKQSIRVMVQNAARYSPEGTAITLGVASDDGGVSYSVRDEGIGMTPEEAGHVFERFWRADAARDVSKEGTGLGLPIARWIVERGRGVALHCADTAVVIFSWARVWAASSEGVLRGSKINPPCGADNRQKASWHFGEGVTGRINFGVPAETGRR